MAQPLSNELRIDQVNETSWQKRFSDLPEKKLLSNLKSAEKIPYLRGIAYAKLNLSAFHFYHSRNDAALRYLLEALTWLKENSNEKGYLRAMILKGNIQESYGDYENALLIWMEAWQASKVNNDRECEGEACSQLGLIYSRLGNIGKSIDFLRIGMKIREDIGDENGVASSLNRMGMVLRHSRKYEESLEHYFRSLEIRKKNNLRTAIYWTYLGIANTYEEMNEYGKSLEFYEEGIEGEDVRCRLQCLLGSGRICSWMGESDEAEKRLKEALKLAGDLKSEALTAEIQSALADHFERSGNIGEALVSLRKYLKNRELLHSSEIQSRLSNIEVAHAVERSEFEKEVYRLKHIELKKAFDVIEENNKYITSSISYASRIQKAMLPCREDFRELYHKMFILYLPKEIISGDFYWIGRQEKKIVIVAADCTGHGVPGALMSMLGISLLEDIVRKSSGMRSGDILNELRKEILHALHQQQDDQQTKDGMDISLCLIDHLEETIQYSGAHNNIILLRNNELCEYHADRMPVGLSDSMEEKFRSQEIKYKQGDMVYMFSDGFSDQIGGPDHKRYKSTRFKELLLSLSGISLKLQKEKLEKEFNDWKGKNEQTDDVLVLGFSL